MPNAHQPAAATAGLVKDLQRLRLVCTGIVSLTLSTLVLVTAEGASSQLGAPTYWPWLLTGLQVLALWSAGGQRWWGWLLGAAVQPPWIAYALVTSQLGFIPGCAISAIVQSYSFLASSKEWHQNVQGACR